jgi:RNA polymerase sigma-70 factor (ECF subfamily)
MGASDSPRLRQLVDGHAQAVESYLRRRLLWLPPADIDDLVDETFVVLWRRLSDVPEGDAERPWVIGVARHVLHNALRSSRRRIAREARVPRVHSAPSAEDEAVINLAAEEAWHRLGEADREVLSLHFWDGIDLSGLASVLGISYTAANARLSRARSRFEALLRTAPMDVQPEAGADT